MILKKRICAAVCAVVFAGSMMSMTPYAIGEPLGADVPAVAAYTVEPVTYKGSNIGSQNYPTYAASTVKSYLTEGTDGYAYMRVQAGAVSGELLVQYFDEEFHIENETTVALKDPVFGAFYATEDNYYVLTGNNNMEESNDVTTFRISKYNKQWEYLGSVWLLGANTQTPFAAGSARMDYDSASGCLLIRTSHRMYKSANDGNNHQANVTIIVNTNGTDGKMEIIGRQTSVANIGVGYVSHSFNQFIKHDGNNIVAVDHGDAYPRSIVLLKYNSDFTKGSLSSVTSTEIIKFPGAVGANYTYASVGGFEISGSSYIVVGNTVDQTQDYGSVSTRNIFVAAVPRSGGDPTVTYLTDYAEGEESPSNPQFVKINDDRFLIMWTHGGKISYTEIDGEGKQVGEILTMDGSLSDCAPQVIDGKVVWYTWDNSSINFYQIDVSDISEAAVTETENGHFYEDTVVGDTLTRECEICDASEELKVQTELKVHFANNYYRNTPVAVLHPNTSFSILVESDSEVYDDTVVFEAADPSMVEVSMGGGMSFSTGGPWIRIESDHHFIVTPIKTGTLVFYIYPKNNPDLKTKYTYTIEIEHTWDNGKVTKDPTCTEEGERTYSCTECDETKTEDIDMIEHSWDKGVVTAPTCTEVGYTTYTCTVCGKTETGEETAPLGHDKKTVTVPAACTEDGTETITCSRCDFKEVNVLEKLGHSYTDTVIDPTCTEKGYTLHECIRGDDSYTDEETAALGHDIKTVVTDSTCSELGNTHEYCTRCDYEKDTAIGLKDHTWDNGKITTEPTCTKNGVKTYTCTVCKAATKTEAVDALGHEYKDTVTDPTCTSGGYTMHECIRGDVSEKIDLTDPLPHNYSDVRVEPTCTAEGSVTPTCEDCGYEDTANVTVLEKLPHNYSDVRVEPTCTAEGSVTPTCEDCGYEDAANVTVLEKLPHNYSDVRVEPTCTAEGSVTPTCEDCGYEDTENITVLEKLPHNYSDVRVEPTCTAEGSVTPTCADCGYVDEENITVLESLGGHSFVDVTVEATCEEDGSITPTCEVCGEVDAENVVVIEKLGHSYVVTSGKEATETESGEKVYTCENCGESYTEEIPALGSTTSGDTENEGNENNTPGNSENEGNDNNTSGSTENDGNENNTSGSTENEGNENSTSGNTENEGSDNNDPGNGNQSGNNSSVNADKDNSPNTGAKASAAAAMFLALAAVTFKKRSDR